MSQTQLCSCSNSVIFSRVILYSVVPERMCYYSEEKYFLQVIFTYDFFLLFLATVDLSADIEMPALLPSSVVSEPLKILNFKFHSCWILEGKEMDSSYFLALHNRLTTRKLRG